MSSIFILFLMIPVTKRLFRKIRDNFKSLLEETQVTSFFSLFRDTLWTGGKRKPPPAPRTSDEKDHTRDEANRKLSALIPGLWTHLYPSPFSYKQFSVVA